MSQSQALSMVLALPLIGLAIWIVAIIAAVVVFFIWAARSGGNVRHPVTMFKYFVGVFFYRLRYNRKLRKRAYHESRRPVPASPERTSRLSEQEETFFFLHEVGLETNIDLHEVDGTVSVTKREYRKLVDFFTLTSKRGNPQLAFAHYDLVLTVQDRSTKVQKRGNGAQ